MGGERGVGGCGGRQGDEEGRKERLGMRRVDGGRERGWGKEKGREEGAGGKGMEGERGREGEKKTEFTTLYIHNISVFNVYT